MKMMNNNHGSILLYVLAIIMLMSILAVAMMAASVSNTRLSAYSTEYEKTYYAAESAAQAAAQIFKTNFEVSKEGCRYGGGVVTEKSVAAFEAYRDNTFIPQAKSEIQKIYQNKVLLNTTFINSKFNGKPFLLTPALDFKVIEVDGDIYDLTDPSDNTKTIHMAYMYIKHCRFSITVTCDNRSVEIPFEISGKIWRDDSGVLTNDPVIIEKVETSESSEPEDPLAPPAPENLTYDDLNNKTINSSSPNYTTYENELKKLFIYAGYTASTMPLAAFTTGQTSVGNASYNETTLGSTTSLKCNGNLTLSNISNNSTLQYLHVTGDLTISGTVNLSKLKYVYVEKNLIINSSAVLTGNNTRSIPSDPTSPIVGSTFVVKENMTVSIPGEIDNCQFYVPTTIMIQSSGGATLLGNSIYVAYDMVSTSTGITFTGSGGNSVNIGTADVAPQFYSAKDITFYVQGGGSTFFYGFFAALGDLKRSGSGTSPIEYGYMQGKNIASSLSGTPSSLSTDAKNTLMAVGALPSTTEKDIYKIDESQIFYVTDLSNSHLNIHEKKN